MRLVVDSSALVAIACGEPERDAFVARIEEAGDVHCSAVTLYETGVVLVQKKTEARIGHATDLAEIAQRAIRVEGVEQSRNLQKVDEERQLPEWRQSRFGVPFDTNRSRETVDADAGRRGAVRNWRLITHRVKARKSEIVRHDHDNARFSSNPEQANRRF